jgi:hypothetical protein
VAIPSPSTNQTVGVTDGSTATDCTVGGGSTFNLCVYNGAAWVILVDGEQGAGTGSVTTIEEQDSPVDETVVYIDFGEGFAVVESPEDEANVDLDVTPNSPLPKVQAAWVLPLMEWILHIMLPTLLITSILTGLILTI